jgi:hypothetical protein
MHRDTVKCYLEGKEVTEEQSYSSLYAHDLNESNTAIEVACVGLL